MFFKPLSSTPPAKTPFESQVIHPSLPEKKNPIVYPSKPVTNSPPQLLRNPKPPFHESSAMDTANFRSAWADLYGEVEEEFSSSSSESNHDPLANLRLDPYPKQQLVDDISDDEETAAHTTEPLKNSEPLPTASAQPAPKKEEGFFEKFFSEFCSVLKFLTNFFYKHA